MNELGSNKRVTIWLVVHPWSILTPVQDVFQKWVFRDSVNLPVIYNL